MQTNLHMGLPGSSPHWSNATLKVNTREDFAEEFHTYELDWTKHHLAFSVGRKYFYCASCKNIFRRRGGVPAEGPGPGRTIQTAVLIKMETLSDTEYRCYPDQSQLSIEIS